MTSRPSFAPLLEGFFTQRLIRQRHASAHTIASYRDTFRSLLRFMQQRLRKAPSALMLDDIDAPLVVAFLDDLEAKRGITARTRNLRLTAIHSFFRYVAFEAPAHAAQTLRVLAIPAGGARPANLVGTARRRTGPAGGANGVAAAVSGSRHCDHEHAECAKGSVRGVDSHESSRIFEAPFQGQS